MTTSGLPSSTPDPTTTTRRPPAAFAPPPSLGNDVERYINACQNGVRAWRAAQVDYPASLTIKKGDTATYVAAVDTRLIPSPAATVIPGLTAASEPAYIQCEIAARLTPLGNALSVNDEHWVLRSFTPTGFVRWAWSVTALKAEDQDLRLELQPAISTQEGRLLVSDDPTAVSSLVTHTTVEQTTIQAAGQWWTDNWPILTSIAAGIGATAIGLIKWMKRAGRELHDKDDKDESRSGASSGAHTSAKSRRRQRRKSRR